MKIAGVRTNFTIPDVHSIALGGGSIVRTATRTSVGPDSVGARLDVDSLVFGGEIMTVRSVPDIRFPLTPLQANDLIQSRDDKLVPAQVREAGLREISRALEEAIDFVKTRQGDAKVILVGGGSVIIGGAIAGVGEVVRPKYLEVANAIGAAVLSVPIL